MGDDGSWQGKRYFKCKMGHGIFMPFSEIMKDPLFLPDSGDESITAYNNLSSIGNSNLGYKISTSVPGHPASTTPPFHHSQSDSDNDISKTPPKKKISGVPIHPEQVESASNSKPLSEQFFDKLLELTTGDNTSEPNDGTLCVLCTCVCNGFGVAYTLCMLLHLCTHHCFCNDFFFNSSSHR